jgi:membrane-associated protease RseP (regulator of RpoE activity)
MRSIAILLALSAVSFVDSAALADEPAARHDRPWFGTFCAPAVDWNMNPMLLVKEVISGSPAEDAGIAEGDFIRALNGTPIADTAALGAALDKSSSGDVLVVTIARGSEVLAVPVTLRVPTESQRAEMAARREALATTTADQDAPHMVFIPQRLCLVGVTYGEALAMSLVPGSVSMDVNEIGACRHPVDPCAPVVLTKQSKSKTVVERMGVRYKLKGDWQAITHDDREQCLEAISRQP